MSVVYGAGGVVFELETVDGAPPAVRVTVSGVTATTIFTLSRLCEGVMQPVPGWRARSITDSDVYMDWCAPLNRPVTYNLSAGGVVVASGTVTLASDTGWLQDPILPEQSVPVNMRLLSSGAVTHDDASLGSFSYAAESSTIPIMGSAYPVAFGAQRKAASGADISFYSSDQSTADKVRQLFEGTPIVLYRPADKTAHLPALTYVLAKVDEIPLNAPYEDDLTRWAVTGDLVAAVMQAAITGTVTYDQVQQMLAGYTYDQVQAKAAGTTYLDWQKNPLIFSTL